MKLTVEIDLDNSAFYGPDPIAEVRRVLEKVAEGVDTEPCGPNGVKVALRDVNGNTVGFWKVTM